MQSTHVFIQANAVTFPDAPNVTQPLCYLLAFFDELLAFSTRQAALGGAASAEECQSRQGADPDGTYYFFHVVGVITGQNYKKYSKSYQQVINISC